jgi:hypothetical protein
MQMAAHWMKPKQMAFFTISYGTGDTQEALPPANI